MRLVADKLTCRRGERTLFVDLSFAVAAGETLVVTGPNGAGKSSLMRILAGFLAPEAGTIALAGAYDADQPSAAMHYLGHRDGLRAGLTISENLVFLRAMLGSGIAIEEALKLVGLSRFGSVPAGLLSAGQRRRAALARLLVSRRPVWLLDEPTSSLDDASQAIVEELLDDHVAKGGLAIIASHLPIAFNARRIMLGSGT